jgi:hypothetical protein
MSPVTAALRDDAAFAWAVRGPVECCALRRLAAICFRWPLGDSFRFQDGRAGQADGCGTLGDSWCFVVIRKLWMAVNEFAERFEICGPAIGSV